MQKSETLNELAAALAKAQAEMSNPAFDATNPHFRNKYASLAAIRNATIPTLSKHGIAVVQSLRSGDHGVVCETMLMHASGQWISDTLELPVSKSDAQGYGSAATYARRYALQALAGIVGDDDDDGDAASKPPAKATPVKQKNGDAPSAEMRQEADQWIGKIEQAQTLEQLETTFKSAYRSVHAFGFVGLTSAVIGAKDARKETLAQEVTV